MTKNVLRAARKGRPPSERAASHTVIMDAVYGLLQKKSVRDLTMEEVAKRAKVGKPTLYKWWPTKATLVLAMLCERMAPNLEKPVGLTAEQSLRLRVRRLNDAIFGAIYYRLLLRSGPLTRRFGEELVEQVLRGNRGALHSQRKSAGE